MKNSSFFLKKNYYFYKRIICAAFAHLEPVCNMHSSFFTLISYVSNCQIDPWTFHPLYNSFSYTIMPTCIDGVKFGKQLRSIYFQLI